MRSTFKVLFYVNGSKERDGKGWSAFYNYEVIIVLAFRLNTYFQYKR